MNAQDFCFWLHGFTELTAGQTPSPAQWKAIREHLDLVFKKVTPPVGMPSVNPTPTISPALPVTYPPFIPPSQHPWLDQWPYTVTCGVAPAITKTATIC